MLIFNMFNTQYLMFNMLKRYYSILLFGVNPASGEFSVLNRTYILQISLFQKQV